MSEQGTPRPWHRREFYVVGSDLKDVACILGKGLQFEAPEDTATPEANLGLILAAVNTCDRLAPGLPPHKLEESVRALVRAARVSQRRIDVMLKLEAVERQLPSYDRNLLAQTETEINAALAPFKHLDVDRAASGTQDSP